MCDYQQCSIGYRCEGACISNIEHGRSGEYQDVVLSGLGAEFRH